MNERTFTHKFKKGDRVFMRYGSDEISGTVIGEDPLAYDRSIMGYMVRLDEKKKRNDPYWGENAAPQSKDILWASERELRFDVLAQLAQI